MQFTYMLAGWEGSAGDGHLFSEAVQNGGLTIPHGKFYLADAGFGVTRGMLVPFRGVRYHLREWGAGNTKPQNRNELYNLRHATYRNVIERVFGVMKRRFKIIREVNSYDLTTNAKIMCALAALHNFIRKHDRDDLPEPWVDDDMDVDVESDENQTILDEDATAQGSHLRTSIANSMWTDYQSVLRHRREHRRRQAAQRRGQRN
jgi:hypothetical protein